MVTELTMYEAQKKKMDGLCDEHDLVWTIQKNQYPIRFTISPLQGVDAQMSMLEAVEDVGYRSPESSMTWIFEDGALTTKVSGGTFTISKTLRTKIENVLLKMISAWQQYFFRFTMEHDALKQGMIPEPDEDDELPEGAEPFEEFEDEDSDDEDFVSSLSERAAAIIRLENSATVELLQRRMDISGALADDILIELENRGVIGPADENGVHEVLVSDAPDDEAE